MFVTVNYTKWLSRQYNYIKYNIPKTDSYYLFNYYYMNKFIYKYFYSDASLLSILEFNCLFISYPKTKYFNDNINLFFFITDIWNQLSYVLSYMIYSPRIKNKLHTIIDLNKFQ